MPINCWIICKPQPTKSARRVDRHFNIWRLEVECVQINPAATDFKVLLNFIRYKPIKRKIS